MEKERIYNDEIIINKQNNIEYIFIINNKDFIYFFLNLKNMDKFTMILTFLVLNYVLNNME